MATGSPFTGRNINTDSGNVLNNPLVAADAYRETLAKSVWGGLTTDIDVANGGLVGLTNTGTEAVVKKMDVSKTAGTRQVRFAYQKEIQGFPATFGQQIASQADKNQFLYSDVEIAEIRSPLMPVHTDMEQRDGYKTLEKFGGSEALAQRNVRLWAGWQYDADHYAAFLRGASDVYLAPASIGGLEKDIGGVINPGATPTTGSASASTLAGSPTSHENIVAFSGAGDGTISESYLTNPAAASRGVHEDNLAHFVYTLQQAGAVAANNKMTRSSIKGLYSLASKKNIRKLKGKNYDYIYQLDWEAVDQLIGTLDGTTADTKFLVGLWKTLAAGADKNSQDHLFDVRYEDLVLDGVLIRPDRYLQAYRPTVITGATSSGGTTDVGRVMWGCGATTTTPQSSWYGLDKFRSYDANTGKVAVGFLLGDTALLSAVDGGMKMMEKEGDFETGKLYGSREWRTVRRAVWQGRDANTTDQIRNEGSMLVLSCIDNSIYKF